MWLEIQIFGFRALWSPYFLIFVIILGLAYYLITGPYRNKLGGKDASPPSFRQQSFSLLDWSCYICRKGRRWIYYRILCCLHICFKW